MGKRKKREKRNEEKDQTAVAENVEQEAGGEIQQEKTPEETQKPGFPDGRVEGNKVLWVTVKFSNGDRFRIPAKVIARRMVELQQAEYGKVLREPETLVRFATTFMTWSDVALSALKYEHHEQVDYILQWKNAEKNYEIEECSPPERVKAETTPDFVRVKDAKEIIRKKKEKEKAENRPKREPADGEVYDPDE